MVDGYLQWKEDKMIPDEAPLSLESFCLVHPGVWDKRRVSEIDLSQPRHETAFWWCHNGPVMLQLTNQIKWPNYPLELIGIYVHINTTKNPWHKDVVGRWMYNCIWYFCTYPYVLSLNGWHALQPTKRRLSCVLTLRYIFICVYLWARQRIHNTLIVVDRYLQLMGDKTIPDSAEPCLELFYPPFVAGIDPPHQGVVDSYNPPWVAGIDLPQSGCCGFFASFTDKKCIWT